jgi:hypothetical protein
MFWQNRSEVAANKAKIIRAKINEVEHRKKITDSEGKVTQPETDYSIHYINDLRAPWFELYDQELYKYLRRELSPELQSNKINYAKYEKAFKDIESTVDDIKCHSFWYLLTHQDFATKDVWQKYIDDLGVSDIGDRLWNATPGLPLTLAVICVFFIALSEIIYFRLFYLPLSYIFDKVISFEIEVLNLFTKGEFAKVLDESIYKDSNDPSNTQSTDEIAINMHIKNIKLLCGKVFLEESYQLTQHNYSAVHKAYIKAIDDSKKADDKNGDVTADPSFTGDFERDFDLFKKNKKLEAVKGFNHFKIIFMAYYKSLTRDYPGNFFANIASFLIRIPQALSIVPLLAFAALLEAIRFVIILSFVLSILACVLASGLVALIFCAPFLPFSKPDPAPPEDDLASTHHVPVVGHSSIIVNDPAKECGNSEPIIDTKAKRGYIMMGIDY